jgi:hypothetical protein
MRHTGAGQQGSTLVESAIVLLLFLVLLIGVLDFSQVLFFHHFLEMRVRAGVRYAVVHPYDPATIRNVVVYNSTTPGTAGLFGLATSMVSVNLLDAGTADSRVEVDITAFKMRFLSPWLMRDFTPGPFRAVMPVESLGAAN